MVPRSACDDECGAYAQDDRDDRRLVGCVLEGPIPSAARLEHLEADAERQERCRQQRSNFHPHAPHHSMQDISTRGDRRSQPQRVDLQFNVLRRARQWAREIKRDVVAMWIAARDPRVPWYVKLLAGVVAGYALSPIDLIPDFVPVLGYLDDVIIVPAGIILVARLIPAELMAEFRVEAVRREGLPTSRLAAVLVVTLWILAFSQRWASRTGSCRTDAAQDGMRRAENAERRERNI